MAIAETNQENSVVPEEEAIVQLKRDLEIDQPRLDKLRQAISVVKVEDGKINEEAMNRLSREQQVAAGHAMKEVLDETGLGNTVWSGKNSKELAVNATKLLQSVINQIDSEKQSENDIWYEGLDKDLFNATDIRKRKNETDEEFHARINDARSSLKQNGVDIESLISEHVSEKQDNLRRLHDACFVLRGQYNPEKNMWGSERAALDFLKDELGVVKQEPGAEIQNKKVIKSAVENPIQTEDEEKISEERYKGQKIDSFLASLPNPEKIKGYEDRMKRLKSVGAI